MRYCPVILYLGVLDGNFVQEMKLAGVRRYAAARGWEVVPVRKTFSTPKRLPALLARYRPVGCIVECFGDATYLRPALLGRIPAVWLDFTPETADAGDLGGRPCVSVDEEAVALAALRELSANRVESIAVVEFQNPLPWSRVRAGAFRRLAAVAGRECGVFETREGERAPSRIRRLSRWLSALPRPCGVFAVNDVAAAEVREACRATLLDIPREIAIVGVDNSPSFCEVSDRPSTSIRIDFERMGYLAAKMLGEKMGSAMIGPLLSETNTAIGAIYAYCGFESSRALDYLFHSRFKTSMREWRKRNARK